MFMLIQLFRSLVTRVMSARCDAKAERLRGPADEAVEKARLLEKKADPTGIVSLIEARMDCKAKADEWCEAEIRAERWAKRKDRAVRPSSRVPTYLAGKLDAALAFFVVYPYVPEVIARVQKLIG